MRTETQHIEPPQIRDVIQRLDFRAKKSLGQNFLLDRNLAHHIVAQAGDITDKTIIEIGPGPGGLTQAILSANPSALHVIDPDERAIAAMNELVGIFPTPLGIIKGDATKINLDSICADKKTVIANLPYCVGTKLLTDWLGYASSFEQMLLMFQYEVGLRITAKPGDRAYSRLSVLCNWLCDCEIVLSLPPEAFTPQPKVHSALVRLVPKQTPTPICDLASLQAVSAACFQQRRKMIRKSLQTLKHPITKTPIGKDGAAQLLKACQLNPTARAETLRIAQYCDLANALHDL